MNVQIRPKPNRRQVANWLLILTVYLQTLTFLLTSKLIHQHYMYYE